MGDTPGRPFYDPRYVGKPAVPRPGERLWTRTRGTHEIAGELRYHGEYGVEAQILKDGELLAGHRFDTRALAVQWLDVVRGDLERTGWQ